MFITYFWKRHCLHSKDMHEKCYEIEINERSNWKAYFFLLWTIFMSKQQAIFGREWDTRNICIWYFEIGCCTLHDNQRNVPKPPLSYMNKFFIFFGFHFSVWICGIKLLFVRFTHRKKFSSSIFFSTSNNCCSFYRILLHNFKCICISPLFACLALVFFCFRLKHILSLCQKKTEMFAHAYIFNMVALINERGNRFCMRVSARNTYNSKLRQIEG